MNMQFKVVVNSGKFGYMIYKNRIQLIELTAVSNQYTETTNTILTTDQTGLNCIINFLLSYSSDN